MIRALLLTALLLGAGPAHAEPPVAKFSASRSECVAPCDVFFDARATRDPDLEHEWEALLDLVYRWDFGDPKSGDWRRGASHHSKNIDTGFVAGHVYDAPGTYEVTLRVSDERTTVEVSHTVTVTSADAEWPGTRTVCVRASERGSFEGCPDGARHVTTDDFDAALSAPSYCNLQGGGVRCLFRRGDAFRADVSTRLSGRAPLLVGAFGPTSTRKPRVGLGAPNIDVFKGGSSNQQKILMDLQIEGTDAPKQKFWSMSSKPARSVLIYRVDTKDLSTAIDIYAGNDRYRQGFNMPRGISVVESSAVSIRDGKGSYGLFSSAERFLFMGNRFVDMDGNEHNVRMGWADGAVVSHNDLGRHCGSTKHILKIHNHKWEEGPGCTSDFIVADNLIEACRDNRTSVAIRPNSNRGGECVEHFIVERNHFKQDLNVGFGGHTSLHVSGQGAAIRSNIFDMSGAATATARGLVIDLQTQDQTVLPGDVRVVNNSCYVDRETGMSPTCLRIREGSGHIVKNNIMYDPRGAGRLIDYTAGSTEFCSKGERFGDCNVKTRTSPYVSRDPKHYADYALEPGSAARASGDFVPSAGIDYTGRLGACLAEGAAAPACNLGAFQMRPPQAPGSPGK